MKQTVYKSTFMDAFQSVRPGNFSYGGLEVLFDYFEELEESTGEEIELDVIAICCEYSELTHEEVRSNYNLDEDDDVIDYLESNTQVIEVDDNTVIIQDF